MGRLGTVRDCLLRYTPATEAKVALHQIVVRPLGLHAAEKIHFQRGLEGRDGSQRWIPARNFGPVARIAADSAHRGAPLIQPLPATRPSQKIRQPPLQIFSNDLLATVPTSLVTTA